MNAGIKLDIELPANAPKSVAKISAIDEPIKTASGLLVVLLKVIVVNCVLSPISARKTVTNVVNRSVNIINLNSNFEKNQKMTDKLRIFPNLT